MAWLDIATAARRISARTAAILLRKPYGPGGGGSRKRPQSGQRRRAPFWPRVRDRNRAPFWAKNRTFSFFFSCHGSDGTLAFRVHVAYRAKVLLD